LTDFGPLCPPRKVLLDFDTVNRFRGAGGKMGQNTKIFVAMVKIKEHFKAS